MLINHLWPKFLSNKEEGFKHIYKTEDVKSMCEKMFPTLNNFFQI
jgi:hypothetical protein